MLSDIQISVSVPLYALFLRIMLLYVSLKKYVGCSLETVTVVLVENFSPTYLFKGPHSPANRTVQPSKFEGFVTSKVTL